MRDILISTAGTSLLANLSKSSDEYLKKMVEHGDAKKISEHLCSVESNDWICGAEINSVNSIIEKELLGANYFHIILVSDTPSGTLVGKILEEYYTTRHNRKSRFNSAGFETVTGLSSDDARRFKTEGLKNLVRLIATTVRSYGSHRIIINATGGFKAQISFAGMIGQALDIPVCYMFENFSEVITLPPQPVSFDFDFWLQNYDLFCQLDAVMEMEEKWIYTDERFHVLMDHVKVDNKLLYDLSATGLLFHETFRNRFKTRQRDLLPPASPLGIDERKIIFEDANMNKHKGLKRYLEKIIAAPFVNRVYTHYYNPSIEKKLPFRRTDSDKIDSIEGCYSNHGAMTKFTICTTATTEQERAAGIVWFNENISS